MSESPLEQLQSVLTERRRVTLGVPSAASSAVEHRFALTPEGASQLAARGVEVRIEAGAGLGIHYPDERYAAAGAQIVTRAEAFAADIVLYLPPLTDDEARLLRPGTLLLTLFNVRHQRPAVIEMLLMRKVTAIALDMVRDRSGHAPFADIMGEIDGRAAIAIASSLLADATHGKGILLGGVAGIVPCEVTVIGAGIAAQAAARSAIGLGALVRMFDTDVYRLREASQCLGAGVSASALHPRVLLNALRTADVVVATRLDTPLVIGSDAVAQMKRGVVTFNLDTERLRPVFAGMPLVDLAAASPGDNPADGTRRVCYVNAAGAVPRTTAMALSTTLVGMFAQFVRAGAGTQATLKMHPGLQRAVFTFMGKPVNERVARMVGRRAVDIALLLQFS